MIKRKILYTGFLALWASLFTACAMTRETPASSQRIKKEAFLVKAMLQPARLSQLFDQALESLKAGNQVLIVFDGNGVTALRRDGVGKTLLHEAKIPEPEHASLGERLGVSQAEAPRNFGDYLQYLANRGAKVFANQTSLKHFGLHEKEMDSLAKLIPGDEVMEITEEEADICHVFGDRRHKGH
jgi:predicted peroxiredoxin